MRHTFKFVVHRISKLAMAMLLMVWGTMNFLTTGLVVMRGHSVPSWKVTVFFGLVVAIVPFAIGVWLAIHSLRRPT